LEHVSVAVEAVFSESLLVPVGHFISQYKSAAFYYWVSRLQYLITVLCNYSCPRTNCLL